MKTKRYSFYDAHGMYDCDEIPVSFCKDETNAYVDVEDCDEFDIVVTDDTKSYRRSSTNFRLELFHDVDETYYRFVGGEENNQSPWDIAFDNRLRRDFNDAPVLYGWVE